MNNVLKIYLYVFPLLLISLLGVGCKQQEAGQTAEEDDQEAPDLPGLATVVSNDNQEEIPVDNTSVTISPPGESLITSPPATEIPTLRVTSLPVQTQESAPAPITTDDLPQPQPTATDDAPITSTIDLQEVPPSATPKPLPTEDDDLPQPPPTETKAPSTEPTADRPPPISTSTPIASDDDDPPPPIAIGTIEIISVEVSQSTVIVSGRGTQTDGTCVYTLLLAENEIAEWWPVDSCVELSGGDWQHVIILGENGAPSVLDDTMEYELRASANEDPVIEARPFLFDLSGPPGS